MVGSRLTTHTYFTLVGPCRVVCPTNTFFSALFNRLRVHLRVVILLAGRDLNRQLVLPGRQRTGRIRGQRARRVVGAVEIQNQSGVAVTSPRTFGTCTVSLPSEGTHVAVMR